MTQPSRRNQSVLAAVRAVMIGLLTWFSLSAMSARPSWLPLVIGAVVGGVALISTELAVLFAVITLSVPVIAASPVLGIALLIVLIASVRYLGADGARGFLLLGLAVVGAFLGPVWAAAALAGYLLGSGEGALAAVLGCLLVEVIGIALGRPAIGATATGATSRAIVSFAHAPANLLSAAWVGKALASLNAAGVDRVTGAFTKLARPVVLLAQPGIWALAAIAAGQLGKTARAKRSAVLGLGAVALGVAVAAAGEAVLATLLRLPIPWTAIASSLATSLLVALGVAAASEFVFPPIRRVAPAPQRKVSMATEDADVDELLRLIATAEDKLATQHTSERVVMITDMKSFSRMTEEDGSVATAKAIQRHRDLLLPIVQRHHGAGKSTGGDGLVSAFEKPGDALLAACEMQTALAAHNSQHPGEREIWVRIGLAQGEVVLDKGGRPFIGAGLNLAARVMNLADGGQIFSTSDIVAGAADTGMPTHSFGEFALKNIAKPVEIVEVLWAEGQVAHDPRDTGAAVASDNPE